MGADKFVYFMLMAIALTARAQLQFVHNETLLFGHFFHDQNYDRNMFPRCAGVREGVNVSLDLALRQIVDLKEQSQLLTAMTWMRWSWTDCRLKWNPDEWGINNLSVAGELLWIPDITLYEGTSKALHKMTEYAARVHSDGTVDYNFPAMIDAICKINMEHFPFDRQTCRLSFSSWVYTKRDVDLYSKQTTGDMENYVNNGEWDLLSLQTERKESPYASKDDAYVEIYFDVVLNRRPVYYLFNIIFPTVLIALVAILSFCLPPASGEKVSLSVTSLLTQTVFMLMLSQEMPTTSETIPLLQQYFAVILCVVSISTILTIFVLNLHYRGIHDKPVPPLLRRVFLNKCMTTVFHPSISHQFDKQQQQQQNNKTEPLMRKPRYAYTNHTEHRLPSPNINDVSHTQRFTQVPIESISLNGNAHIHRAHTYLDSDTHTSHPHRKQNDTLPLEENELLLTNLAEMLAKLTERGRNKDRSKSICKEWGDLATVLDRIFFAFCLSAFVIMSFLLFRGKI